MALSPVIPTSFVPKQPVSTGGRRMQGGGNVFLLVSLVVAGLMLAAAGALFGYQKYLEGVRDVKSAKLAEAEQHISSDTVEDFIRLRNRLAASGTILNEHVALSQFFDLLESVTLQSVRFSTLSVSVDDSRAAEIRMTGKARSFNALAAESAAFAAEKRIKRAIFSSITVEKDGTVSFSLSADLDPKLVVMAGASVVQAAPVSVPGAATTTPAAPAASAKATTTSPNIATTTLPGPITTP